MLINLVLNFRMMDACVKMAVVTQRGNNITRFLCVLLPVLDVHSTLVDPKSFSGGSLTGEAGKELHENYYQSVGPKSWLS